ncbi:tRNA threonylcarbamoyladenosine biosynthesis protein TsaE [Sphingobacterium allocomposti]|jgi:tRNA threonylcarbamoyladenosine biosynthesis protein TsaE|uniref:tRNA threonylcarbamoyladenosine biosynthesis protein TsaE n=1 Tax=Sphingobacterium allocomposti TaxID=415956 RepID=A0A5S5D5V3_9SPHI|nr:tRNA (adenosine(37)-N6)-threonylcarbamoyltransferase complex ATPase subunit type 1 TsaE [Sphingobacterium composti Yoo et al. 2007 non Ten et al. 2007]TYP90029.1 tRNA threonylcarbamoyladenosine biosynthesis protein TsaE [Sphingobacterium composti Yoo et al. 2007 non Ten et al. 2007]HLS96894.1 tRNA (adenosine(37)-N6)-threonylcarbamoyltransferase complex ATPase subunit type 1 TsaE [Sphingobacterium sp.]
MEITINSLQEINSAAEKILTGCPRDRIFLLYGTMGAGKTTLVNALCQHLGVTEPTSSPTFAIVNEYLSPHGPVYHFDFYRLKDEAEAYDLGYEEYFYANAYCFVEWPERIPNLLPPDARTITIDVLSPESRHIVVK